METKCLFDILFGKSFFRAMPVFLGLHETLHKPFEKLKSNYIY